MDNSFEIIEAICNECTNIITFPHSKRRKLNIFSIQRNYCYNCKKETTFFILFDKNYAYNLLNEKKELSNKEFHIKVLLDKHFKNSKNKQKNKFKH